MYGLASFSFFPFRAGGKYAGCYLYGIRSGDTDASYGSPLGGGYGTNGILVHFIRLIFIQQDNGFFTKREMVIQLMGFYRNFVQIDNG